MRGWSVNTCSWQSKRWAEAGTTLSTPLQSVPNLILFIISVSFAESCGQSEWKFAHIVNIPVTRVLDLQFGGCRTIVSRHGKVFTWSGCINSLILKESCKVSPYWEAVAANCISSSAGVSPVEKLAACCSTLETVYCVQRAVHSDVQIPINFALLLSITMGSKVGGVNISSWSINVYDFFRNEIILEHNITIWTQ